EQEQGAAEDRRGEQTSHGGVPMSGIARRFTISARTARGVRTLVLVAERSSTSDLPPLRAPYWKIAPSNGPFARWRPTTRPALRTTDDLRNDEAHDRRWAAREAPGAAPAPRPAVGRAGGPTRCVKPPVSVPVGSRS